MGIVVLAALAATAAIGGGVVTITATRRRPKSAASAGNRSYWFSAQRYSIANGAKCPAHVQQRAADGETAATEFCCFELFVGERGAEGHPARTIWIHCRNGK